MSAPNLAPDHRPDRAHARRVGGAPHLEAVPDPDAFAALRVWAEMLDDHQRSRIANTNRATRGGLDPASYAAQLEAVEAAEHAIALALRREYRRVAPDGVRAWQDAERGVGEHLVARLLGAIGHPRWAVPHWWEANPDHDPAAPSSATNRKRVLKRGRPYPRRVSELWSYCGHGDPQRQRRRGMTADEAASLGRPHAKMLTHLLAEATVKAGLRKRDGAPDRFSVSSRYAIGRYAQVYLDRRAHTGEHRPAWTDAHRHNDALRIVGKELLRDLWSAAA